MSTVGHLLIFSATVALSWRYVNTIGDGAFVFAALVAIHFGNILVRS